MKDITEKYNRLDKAGKKEIRDFLDFLLTKRKKSKPRTFAAYKKKILKVSQWSEEDIALIQKNQKILNEWKPKEW